jgi:hypothetical protein
MEFPLVRNPLLSSLSTRNDLLKTIKYELNFFSATSDPYLFFPNLMNCFLARHLSSDYGYQPQETAVSGTKGFPSTGPR